MSSGLFWWMMTLLRCPWVPRAVVWLGAKAATVGCGEAALTGASGWDWAAEPLLLPRCWLGLYSLLIEVIQGVSACGVGESSADERPRNSGAIACDADLPSLSHCPGARQPAGRVRSDLPQSTPDGTFDGPKGKTRSHIQPNVTYHIYRLYSLGIAHRIISQVVFTGARVFGRAFAEAYKQASASQKFAAAGNAQAGNTAASSGLTLDEACRILNVAPPKGGQGSVEKTHEQFKRLFDMNDPKRGGSFYLQSKVLRARERIEMEVRSRAEESEREEEMRRGWRPKLYRDR
ncbi:hypothetical protein D0868_16465 [Hortaea werneckii]|uniref:Mitochondrial import inner membrane translocase subunit TIM16 n=1 Tax=Hortaea werneckii TaxID=91943 RepID=A0A3M6WIX7_HORWE|nr:hypothetical protein D0868_16465 [Hortaea werneckii]